MTRDTSNLSPESRALADQYRSMGQRMAAGPVDLATSRSILDELQQRTAEPERVLYSEGTLGARPALWTQPLDADPKRVLLYFHGGGFVSGSLASHRKLVGHLTRAAGIEGVLLDYRLSPENVFPAALEDARVAYLQLLDRGYDARDVAVGGDSAGANLAVALGLALREEGLPLPAAILGISPWFDMEVVGRSLDENRDVDVLVSREATALNAAMYCGDTPPREALVNPLFADPTGLPPVYLTCGGYEAFRDNGEDFAEHCRAAGVDVTLEVSPGMQHVYPLMAGRAPEADATVASVGAWIRSQLGRR